MGSDCKWRNETGLAVAVPHHQSAEAQGAALLMSGDRIGGHRQIGRDEHDGTQSCHRHQAGRSQTLTMGRPATGSSVSVLRCRAGAGRFRDHH
jgi:hypothetical protein